MSKEKDVPIMIHPMKNENIHKIIPFVSLKKIINPTFLSYMNVFPGCLRFQPFLTKDPG